MKRILISILVGAISCAIAGGIGLALSILIAPSLGISGPEGEAGYFALTVAILFGFIGLFAGSIFSLFKSGLRGSRLLVGPLASISSIVAVSALSFGAWYYFQPHILNPNGPTPKLYFEVLPSSMFTADSLPEMRVALNTDENSMDADLENSLDRYQANQHRIPGSVDLYYRTSARLLVVKLPNGEARIFKLNLPANPIDKKYTAWSEWHKADYQDKPGQAQPTKVESEDDYQIRYRVDSIE